jgi:hypothetical protein
VQQATDSLPVRAQHCDFQNNCPFDSLGLNEQSAAEANEQFETAHEQSADANEGNLSRVHCSAWVFTSLNIRCDLAQQVR